MNPATLPATLKCTCCHEDKPFEEFKKKDSRYSYGVQKFCKDCEKQKRKIRWELHKDRYNQQKKDKRINDPDYAERDKERIRKYREDHKQEIKQKWLERDEACHVCGMMVKQLKQHERSQFHKKCVEGGFQFARKNSHPFLEKVKDCIDRYKKIYGD